MVCSVSAIRTVVLVHNALVLLCGLVLLVCGAVLLTDPARLAAYLQFGGDQTSRAAAVVCLVLGATITAACGVGALGACRRSVRQLDTYLALVIIIAGAEVSVAYFLLFNEDWLSSTVKRGLEAFLQRTYTSNNSLSDAWDWTQQDLQCCGVSSPLDYGTSVWFNETGRHEDWRWPKSCCVLSSFDYSDPQATNWTSCRAGLPSGQHGVHAQGCFHHILAFLSTCYIAAIVLLFLLVLLKSLLIWFTAVLIEGILDERRIEQDPDESPQSSTSSIRSAHHPLLTT